MKKSGRVLQKTLCKDGASYNKVKKTLKKRSVRVTRRKLNNPNNW